MRKFYLLAAIMIFFLKAQAFPVQNLQSFYQGKLAHYVKHRTSFFASKCEVNGDMVVLFIPQTRTIGIYGEFSRTGIEENGADVIISDAQGKLGELMFGGLATHVMQQKIINALVKEPFTLIAPSRVKSFLAEKPGAKCKLEQPFRA